MLYMLSAVQIDTAPFSADQFSKTASADFAEKGVMGALPPSEFVGPGKELITISGTLIPHKIGGLSELEKLQGYRKKGAALPLMRGDGTAMGSYIITNISEKHGHLQPGGVGFVVKYTLSLKLVPDDQEASQQTIEDVLSLFSGI